MAKRSRLVDETDAARAAEAIDVSRAEAPVGRASSSGLRVDRWYDRFARSWCVRIVDSTGAQQGDALFSGTREGADAHERDLRARIETTAEARAHVWWDAPGRSVLRSASHKPDAGRLLGFVERVEGGWIVEVGGRRVRPTQTTRDAAKEAAERALALEAAASARRWRASGPAVIDEHDRLVCVVEQTPSRPSAEEAAAIARLISKAPELLKACEGMLLDATPRADAVQFARAIIAAAKGGAS